MQPLGITDAGGFVRAAQGLELCIEALNSSVAHPQIRVGHALLWANVLNDAFHRAGGSAYVTMRDTHIHGRVLPGLMLAFNALKHGAAVCTSIRRDIEGQGWAAGPWILTQDVEALIRTFGKPPSVIQVESYKSAVSGRLLREPFGDALDWFEQAQNHWTV